MEARVIKIQEAARDYQTLMREFDAIREESLRMESEKRRVERIENFIKQIPMRFRNKTFHDYVTEIPEQIRIKSLCIRYVSSFKERLKDGSSLIFKGKPGTGKSLLSLIIYQELAKKDFKVRYEPSLEFIQNLIDIKFKSHTNYLNYLQSMDQIDLLIIDEVSESISKDGLPTEIEKQVLFQIINRRYESNLCTIVITNRDQNDLVSRLGLPVVDRLSEKGISLAFDWNSYRQK